MTSKIELILLALVPLLQSTGAAVERNTVLPTRIPAGGLMILRDGEPGQPEVTMSPLMYHYEHVAEIEMFVQPVSGARNASFDALKVALAAVIVANRTLGGLCDWIEASAPRPNDLVVEGAVLARAATVPLTLFFATSDPLI